MRRSGLHAAATLLALVVASYGCGLGSTDEQVAGPTDEQPPGPTDLSVADPDDEQPPGPTVVTVAAAGETDAVEGVGDVADDPAIWHHPSDPHASLILGTNKSDDGGLHVYDASGETSQFLQVGKLNNVDVRYDLEGLGDYAAASNRSDTSIDIFSINDGVVELVGAAEVPADPYGLCLGVLDGVHYAVVTTDESSTVRQYELTLEDGLPSATLVRSFDLDGPAEGCVVDDERGDLYIADQAQGIFRLPLDPWREDDPRIIDTTGEGGHLVPDVEGLTVYRRGQDEGFLLASSQGADRIEVYRLGGDYEHLGSFRVVAGDDKVKRTDGIEATSAPVGDFRHGLLVIHDKESPGAEASNFKLVAWDAIAGALSMESSD